jgi:hypothetical protein
MKTLLATAFTILFFVAGLVTPVGTMAETKSLRGDHLVDEPSAKPQISRWQEDKEPAFNRRLSR